MVDVEGAKQWFLEHLDLAMNAKDAQELFQEPLVRAAAALLLCLLLLVVMLKSPAQDDSSKGGRAPPKARELRGYTRAEVARHKGEDDLWLIIRNKGSDRLKVYDVTAYIEHHPGGDAIFAHAGDDCTEGFLGIQHPPTTYDLVEEYCIGWLEDP